MSSTQIKSTLDAYFLLGRNDRRLSLRVFNAQAGLVKMLPVKLNPDISQTCSHSGDADWSVPHEWVENHVSRLSVQHQEVVEQFDWLWRRMVVNLRNHLPDADNISRYRVFTRCFPFQFSAFTMRDHDHFVVAPVSPAHSQTALVPYHGVKKRQSARIHTVSKPSKSRLRPAAAAAAAAAAGVFP